MAPRVGIIGTNTISDAFVAACRASGALEPAGVLSRNPATAATFADRHGLALRHTDLDAFVADPGIDAVYVASPNLAHAGQAAAAIAAGKHVLCEKVLAPTPEEAEALFDAAASRGVVLLEAMRALHEPGMATIAETLPRLGRIWQAQLHKSQYSSRYDAVRAGGMENAFDPSLGNSALADIGVYCLQPALHLFGAPERVDVATRRLASGFEAAGSLVLHHRDAVVVCTWSKVTTQRVPSWIEGEDGTLVIDSIADATGVRLVARDGRVTELVPPATRTLGDALVGEVTAFAAMCGGEASAEPFRAVSVATARVLRAAAAG